MKPSSKRMNTSTAYQFSRFVLHRVGRADILNPYHVHDLHPDMVHYSLEHKSFSYRIGFHREFVQSYGLEFSGKKQQNKQS